MGAGSFAERSRNDIQHASQQPSPRQLERPSYAAAKAIASAASGSAHHHPSTAFAPRPTRSAIERYAQSCVCEDSLTAAAELSLSPTRRFAQASSGIVAAVKAASPIPTQLVLGSSAATSVRTAS